MPDGGRRFNPGGGMADRISGLDRESVDSGAGGDYNNFMENLTITATGVRCMDYGRKISRREKREGFTKDGYGIFELRPGCWVLAHEIAWSDRNGEIPDGYMLLHKCGERACVNADHLELIEEDKWAAARERIEVSGRLRLRMN